MRAACATMCWMRGGWIALALLLLWAPAAAQDMDGGDSDDSGSDSVANSKPAATHNDGGMSDLFDSLKTGGVDGVNKMLMAMKAMSNMGGKKSDYHISKDNNGMEVYDFTNLTPHHQYATSPPSSQQRTNPPPTVLSYVTPAPQPRPEVPKVQQPPAATASVVAAMPQKALRGDAPTLARAPQAAPMPNAAGMTAQQLLAKVMGDMNGGGAATAAASQASPAVPAPPPQYIVWPPPPAQSATTRADRKRDEAALAAPLPNLALPAVVALPKPAPSLAMPAVAASPAASSGPFTVTGLSQGLATVRQNLDALISQAQAPAQSVAAPPAAESDASTAALLRRVEALEDDGASMARRLGQVEAENAALEGEVSKLRHERAR